MHGPARSRYNYAHGSTQAARPRARIFSGKSECGSFSNTARERRRRLPLKGRAEAGTAGSWVNRPLELARFQEKLQIQAGTCDFLFF